jgi:hypothetical protein
MLIPVAIHKVYGMNVPLMMDCVVEPQGIQHLSNQETEWYQRHGLSFLYDAPDVSDTRQQYFVNQSMCYYLFENKKKVTVGARRMTCSNKKRIY